MRRDYGKYMFTAGILLLIIQFLIILFDVFSGTTYANVQFAVVNELTFISFIEQTWASILGVVLLVVIYVRRITKCPEPLMELVGALLWVIQILGLYVEGTSLISFVMTYILGILGIFLILATGVYDSALVRK